MSAMSPPLGLARVAKAAVLLAVLVGAMILALNVNGYYVFVLANVALLALVGVGMNALIGLGRQISFGHVGFYAIGAYVVAVLGQAGVSFWIAWPLGALLAIIAGYCVHRWASGDWRADRRRMFMEGGVVALPQSDPDARRPVRGAA